MHTLPAAGHLRHCQADDEAPGQKSPGSYTSLIRIYCIVYIDYVVQYTLYTVQAGEELPCGQTRVLGDLLTHVEDIRTNKTIMEKVSANISCTLLC